MTGLEGAGSGVSRVLRAVHAHGTLTRSDICSLTGLNRSTVATLLAALVDAGVVEEHTGVSGSVGRPSLSVSAIPDSVVAIGWDIRVDSSAAIVMGLGGSVLQRWHKDHRRGSTDLFEVAARVVTGASEMVESLPDHVRLVGIGLAMPGVIDPTTTPPRSVVHRAPSLGWADVPFAEVLDEAMSERFGSDVPVLLGNDANLGAMAEWTRGAGRKSRVMVFVSGDVGIGGGIVIDGQLMTGASGFAGEIGHIRFDANGASCRCGSRGCWETVVGAETIVRGAGMDPMHATADDVIAAARGGDAVAQEVCANAARAVGQGLATIVTMVNPDTIVLAGHLSSLLADYRHTMEQELEFTLSRRSLELKIVPPAFGRDSIVIGAAELGFEPALTQPRRIVDEPSTIRVD